MNDEWDFSRLPESESYGYVEAYKTNDARKLLRDSRPIQTFTSPILLCSRVNVVVYVGNRKRTIYGQRLKWLTDTIEIAHDLKGFEIKHLSTLIEMPEM